MTNDTIQTPAGPIAPGHLITYQPFSGPVRTVVVEAVHADIKNGRPGFDGQTTSGEDVWGYASQVLTALGDPR